VKALNGIKGVMEPLTSFIFGEFRKSEIHIFHSETKLGETLGQSENESFLNKKLLLVEDSLDNQMLYHRVLSKLGFQVEMVSNGKEALEIVKTKEFDLILMDMQMPEMDGHTTTQILRKRNVRCPIVALTAHAMKEDRERCLQSGCDDYLSKPASKRQLVEVLEKNLLH